MLIVHLTIINDANILTEYFILKLFSSVAYSCPTLCDLMDSSTPDFPVHHQLPEFTQIQVQRVGDSILPSQPLSSPSTPAPNPSHIFSNVSALRMRWPKYWSFSFSISPSNEHQANTDRHGGGHIQNTAGSSQ